MTLSLNDRARELADRLAADAEAARVEVQALANGARVIDCREGGFAAGRAFAEICMGGLGEVAYAPLVLDGRWVPGVTVTTDHPEVACLAAQLLHHLHHLVNARGAHRVAARLEAAARGNWHFSAGANLPIQPQPRV